MIIDFSAHDAWGKCPGYWYEKYVNRRRKHWPSAQRDDALALGSLVHEGLRLWQQRHMVGIPQAIQDELNPTRECYDLALELVYGYAREYPEETWPLIVCEEPVTFPLVANNMCWACSHCGATGVHPPYRTQCMKCGGQVTVSNDNAELIGLAKIDSYFYVPEYTEIETGLGIRQVLTPGWWIHEYKTKSPYVQTGLYMQSWEMGMQASYQITALQTLLDTGLHAGVYPTSAVQGVLVNVLEKPKRHIPQRKCKQCQESYEFATWVPTGTGEYACPVCGNRQALAKLKENVPQIAPAYYRITVTRTARELEHARQQMVQVGERMQAMGDRGLYSEPWNKAACVDFRWKKSCDYFGVHKNFISTLDDPEFEAVPEYRGLTQLEVVEQA